MANFTFQIEKNDALVMLNYYVRLISYYCLAVGVINMDGQRMQADTGELLQGTSGRREIDLL